MVERILGLMGHSANNALKGGTELYVRGFQALGFEVDLVDLTQPDGLDCVRRSLEKGGLRFAFGIQGIGSLVSWDQEGKTWERFQTPFVCLHYDHPCYEPAHHTADSRWIGNLYHSHAFLEDKLRYMPSPQLSQAVSFCLLDALTPSTLSFDDRPIKLLYLKTGVSPESLMTFFAGQSVEMRKLISDLIAQAMPNPDLSICDLVAACFTNLQIDRQEQKKLFWYLVSVVDGYVRAQRAVIFARWLMRQEGGVIVGDGWDFLDKTESKARFLPAVDIQDVGALYEQAQIVCNTNPQGYDFIHERILVGLSFGSCVISDANLWWKNKAHQIPALALFDWQTPIEPQLNTALASLGAQKAETAPQSVKDFLTCNPFERIVSFAHEIRTFAMLDTKTAQEGVSV